MRVDVPCHEFGHGHYFSNGIESKKCLLYIQSFYIIGQSDLRIFPAFQSGISTIQGYVSVKTIRFYMKQMNRLIRYRQVTGKILQVQVVKVKLIGFSMYGEVNIIRNNKCGVAMDGGRG